MKNRLLRTTSDAALTACIHEGDAHAVWRFRGWLSTTLALEDMKARK